MKTIKKAIALVLTALMVLSLVPAGVSAQPIATPGMTLAEFKLELTTRMESFYANITPEQATILKAMGDSLNLSTLRPYTAVDPAWTTILGDLVTPELKAKYSPLNTSDAAPATAVLAKMIYSTMELMFYLDTTAGTDSAKLEAAIDNAYTNLYLPMDELAGNAFTQAALSSVLTEVKSTISSKLGDYASSILNAMSSNNSADYVDIIANGIASVAVTNLFNTATAGSTLNTLKTNFATNAGFNTTDLGSLVGKIYSATASLESTQKAPSVQFNQLINSIITFQGTNKTASTIIPFDQAISLDSTSATDNVIYFKINPNRTIAGITVDMTNYFVASSSNETTLTATKQLISGAYYIKLTAHPIVGNETCYVKIYRNSVGGENYFFNIQVNVIGTVLPSVDKTDLTTAISNANTLIASKTVGTSSGNVPQTAKNNFQAVINSAIIVNTNTSATQNEVTAAVSALATATTAFINAVIPGNVELKRVGDPSFTHDAFTTIADATTFVKSKPNAVKGDSSVNAVNYYAVPKDGITQIENKNISTRKIIVSGELSSSEIPVGAVIWVSTNPGSTPVVSDTDYYTKGINAFSTIQAAIDAAPIGAEIVIKDGTYIEDVNVNKQLTIRNGSSVRITGAMIMAAAADGSVIAGITIVSSGGKLSSIKVDAPNITIENLILEAASIEVNAPNTTIQNVTSKDPIAGIPVITLTGAADDTTISDFTFTTGGAPGSAITIESGATGTAINDSVVVGSTSTAASTITYIDPADAPIQSNVSPVELVVPVDVSNTGNETQVELKIRNVVTANGTIKAVVYLTGIDPSKGIDGGHAVVGYSMKTLWNPLSKPVVTPCASFAIVNDDTTPIKLNSNPGTLEVAYRSINTANPKHPEYIDVDGTGKKWTLDLFEVTFPPLLNAGPNDVYRIWLSGTSPNNELISSISSTTSNGTQFIPKPMLYSISPDYIWISVPNVTLTLHIVLPYVVKNNLTYEQQGFKVEINEVGKPITKETFKIYTGASADPNSTHTGATLVSLDAAGTVLTTANTDAYVSEYVLTLPGYPKDTQYDVKFIGDGYNTYTKRAILYNDLSITVFNNLTSLSLSPTYTFLAGDINGTPGTYGPVDTGDLTAMAQQYGLVSNSPGLIKYDINRDQKVSILDIAYLINNMVDYRIAH